MHKNRQVSGGSLPLAGVPGPPATDAALYREHYGRLLAYTDRLRDGRCRRTRRFDDHLTQTLSVFEPLFAPWNMEAVFALYMHGPQRFSQLKRTLGTISSRVLTDKLRHLVGVDLVRRGTSDDRPLYTLTTKGEVVARHLHPILFFLHS